MHLTPSSPVNCVTPKRYGTRNYASFRKFISQRGYGPFKKDLDTIFRFIDDVEVCLVPTNDDTNCWRKIMHRYKLLPYDALIVSACISNGINKIATFDKDFRRVDLLELVELKE